MQPIISITDFTHLDQVQRMLGVFRAYKPRGSDRRLGVGVMMSHKTLNGIPTKWADAFPPKENIATIFSGKAEELYHCLHYADYDGQTSAEDLARAIGYGGPRIHAIQLDMPWPDPRMIAEGIRASGASVEVILQVGKAAMDQVGNTPTGVVRRLAEYDGLIRRVLLDKSGGKGLGMDAEGTLPFLLAIAGRFPALGLVAAGGLGPKTMHLVTSLVRMFPDLSIDAQGRLRPSGSALDPIDWAMAEEYLRQAFPMSLG